MNYKKYKAQIHEKYLTKIQYIIEILNSCETEDQVDSCVDWCKRLVIQWRKYEDRILDEKFGGWTACNASIEMIHELNYILDVFSLSVDRKRKELSKNEEN